MKMDVMDKEKALYGVNTNYDIDIDEGYQLNDYNNFLFVNHQSKIDAIIRRYANFEQNITFSGVEAATNLQYSRVNPESLSEGKKILSIFRVNYDCS